jgi:glycosyltransferase 2 family protein
METTQPAGSKTHKWLKGLLKVSVSAVCLWYVSRKIDLPAAGKALQSADWSFLLIALALFITSKITAAFRLNFYFRNTGIRLSGTENLRLYWLGMLYNLALPGSVSGDAYKVVLLSKRFDVRYRKTTAAVLLDRFSGLLGLGILLAIYGFIALPAGWYPAAIAAAALSAVIVLRFAIHRWLQDFIPSFNTTLLLGLLVQALQVLCAYAIMSALHLPLDVPAYIFLFLLSSAVAVLPLTIGGLGAREIVFLEGSAYFGLPQEHSVLISILFYLITLLTSAAGFWYVFHDPLQKRKDS